MGHYGPIWGPMGPWAPNRDNSQQAPSRGKRHIKNTFFFLYVVVYVSSKKIKVYYSEIIFGNLCTTFVNVDHMLSYVSCFS